MNENRSHGRTWLVVVAAGLLFAAANLSYSDDAPAEDWKAPARAARKQNPIPPSADSSAAGKKVYVANCVACHGATGKGDGPAAIACTPRPKDLSDPKISSQSDGELFWKITQGKKPMPSFETLLSDTNRWNVVNYLRVLAPPPAAQPSSN